MHFPRDIIFNSIYLTKTDLAKPITHVFQMHSKFNLLKYNIFTES